MNQKFFDFGDKLIWLPAFKNLFKSLLSKIRKESSIRINDNNQLGFK